MASMNALKEENGFNHLEWNFFAASHGKGAVDGIGGSVKRSVWVSVKSRRAIVNNAQEFYELARSLSKNIFFIFVEKEVIQEKKAVLDADWEGLKNIPGIQSKHFFKPEDSDDSISVARTSLSPLKSTFILKLTKPITEAESDWDDADEEPLINSRIQEILCPDESAPSASNHIKLRVSDVYSDSDSDEASPTTTFQTLPADTTCAVILPKDICAGLYVLVQLPCKSGKIITHYRYVGLCQSDMDEDREVKIQFLTTIDGKRFTEIKNDIAHVKFEDIIGKFEEPQTKIEEKNKFIEFPLKIDVFEKKKVVKERKKRSKK
ncbi:hypothetical protein O0L34_g5284 [Tuta absoluta]|nr:hypothetical protein O0L34_g5284 [Tuta absoluta]